MHRNTRRLGTSAEERFFEQRDEAEELQDRLDREQAESRRLRNLVLQVSAGFISPVEALVAVGIDPQIAARQAVQLPSREEVRAARDAMTGQAVVVSPVREGSVVYYLKRNDLVKIGTTTRFEQRMRSIYAQPADLLAVEDGGYKLEHERHAQFRSLRVEGSELFVPRKRLTDHIAALHEAQPDPWAYAVQATSA